MSWIEVSSMVVAWIAVIGFMANVQRYNGIARNRIYERLDECKRSIDEKIDKDFARKDICSVTHKQVEKELREIKEQTILIPEVVAQLKTLINGKANK